MKKSIAIPFALSLLAVAVNASAAPTLVAVGTMDANVRDLSTRTSAPLDSGETANLLAGLSSGLAYAGGNTFLCLPDRGPNTTTYLPEADSTTTYIPRVHSIQIDTNPNLAYDPGTPGSLPLVMNLHATSTTLLRQNKSLAYDLAYGVDGIPALNLADPLSQYFTGRADAFNPAPMTPIYYARDGRLDPEGIRVSNDGKYFFISDEYGPYVYKFSRTTGKRAGSYTLPAHYYVPNKVAFEKGVTGEIAMNTIGRTTNKGMEGLAITPDGLSLVGIMQASLRQDTSKYIRIAKIDLATKAVKEYAYLLTDGSGASEILAVNNTQFLVLERDGKGLGDNSNAVVKKLYLIDLATATEVTGAATIGPGSPVVAKTLYLDLVAAMVANGVPAADIPAKPEGIAFGPDVTIAGVTKRTLMVGNDNDFVSTITDTLHPTGIKNPNQFWLFTLDPSDLPGYVPQPVAPNLLDLRDRG
jgi:hypothetical protein